MSERAPYSRIYWTIRLDDRLEKIYPDDRLLAAWVRLLIDADMAWPAPASLPASASKASVAALEAAGVIEKLPGGLFRFHGLDSERGRRRDAAASSAASRWDTGRTPNAMRSDTERNPDDMLAEPSRAEPRQAEPSKGPPASRFMPNGEDRDALDVYHEVTGYRPWGEWSGDELRVAIREYGNATVETAICEEWKANPDRKALMKAVQVRLARDAERSRPVAAKRPKRQVTDPALVREALREAMGLKEATG